MGQMSLQFGSNDLL